MGEALEENFQVCKEAKKAAAAVFKKQKKIDGKKIKGDATDGNCISNKADKENGDPNLKSDFYPPILAAHINVYFISHYILRFSRLLQAWNSLILSTFARDHRYITSVLFWIHPLCRH